MIISSAIGNISSRRNRMDFMNGQDKISAGRHSPVQEIQGKAVQETQGRAVLMNISKSIRDVWL